MEMMMMMMMRRRRRRRERGGRLTYIKEHYSLSISFDLKSPHSSDGLFGTIF